MVPLGGKLLHHLEYPTVASSAAIKIPRSIRPLPTNTRKELKGDLKIKECIFLNK